MTAWHIVVSAAHISSHSFHFARIIHQDFFRRCSIFVSVLFLVFFSCFVVLFFFFFFGFNSAGIQWNLQRQRKELQIDFTQFFFRRFHMQRICFYDFAAFPFRLPLPPLSAFSKAIKLQCACHQKCTRYAPPTANCAPPSAASVRQGNVIVSGAHCHRHRHSRVVPCFACHFDSCCCCWIACNMPVGVVVLVVVIKVGTL